MCHRTDESDIDSSVTTRESERSSIEPSDLSGSTSSTIETENESDIEEQSVSGSSTSGLPLSPPTNLTPKGFVYSICMI
jgi:hypothetical protein